VSSHGELKTQQTAPKSFAETKKPTMQAFFSFSSKLSLSHDDAIVLVLIKTWQWDPI
jgi:hypothetical protein